MEVYLEVFTQSFGDDSKHKSNEAYYTFVSLDNGDRPKKVNEVVLESDREKRMYEGALRRRELRLILAGRMKPENASELKAIFL